MAIRLFRDRPLPSEKIVQFGLWIVTKTLTVKMANPVQFKDLLSKDSKLLSLNYLKMSRASMNMMKCCRNTTS